jgi:hypothetical protein
MTTTDMYSRFNAWRRKLHLVVHNLVKKSIPTLKVLSTYEQQLVQFNKETCLTATQLRGEDAIPAYEVPNRPNGPLTKYEQQLLDFAKLAGLNQLNFKGVKKSHHINGQINRSMRLDVSLCGCNCSSIFQRGYMNCTSGTCHKLPPGWICSMFALRTIITSMAEMSSLFPWRNFSSYSIWMQFTSHSSVAGLKCLFYYTLKTIALATVSHI